MGREKKQALESGEQHNLPQPFRSLTVILLTLYSAIVIYWMFIGFGREVRTGGPLRFNLVPLRTILLFFNPENDLSMISRLVNLLGNVAVFIPFGMMAPLVKRRLNSLFRLAIYTVPSVLILECLQMLLHVGSFDVDDLLLNWLGVWSGYGLLRLWRTTKK